MLKQICIASTVAIIILLVCWTMLPLRNELLFSLTFLAWAGAFGAARAGHLQRDLRSGPAVLMLVLAAALIPNEWQMSGSQWKLVMSIFGLAIWGLTLWWARTKSIETQKKEPS